MNILTTIYNEFIFYIMIYCINYFDLQFPSLTSMIYSIVSVQDGIRDYCMFW